MAKIKVLSTKELDPSLITLAKEHDIDISQDQFISIHPVWNQETQERILRFATDKKLHIALTSAHAADILNSYAIAGNAYYMVNWQVFCLEGKTRSAVQNAQFMDATIIATAQHAEALAEKIIESGVREIIFFCGNKRRDDLPALLKKAHIKVEEVILYETNEVPKKVGNDFDAVLFFSPSGVRSFFALNELKQGAVCFVIGSTTASSLESFTQNQIACSPVPDPQILVEEVIEYYKKKSLVN